MKITFNFDRDCRAFNMEPEDALERAVLEEMEEQSAKGQSIQLTKITHMSVDSSFRVEMRVNGHQAKVKRDE